MVRMALVFGLVLALAGCSGTDTPPHSSPSPTVPVTAPAPTASAVVTPVPSTAPPWPAGWNEAFCEYFAQLVIVTELAVDIEPVIEAGPRRDARDLANELATTPTYARGLADALEDWPFAEHAVASTRQFLDTAELAGQQYVLYLDNGDKAVRRQARDLRTQLGDEIATANDALGLLQSVGLGCPEHELQLEQP